MTHDADTIRLLFDAARAQNEWTARRSEWDRARAAGGEAAGARPGDVFNTRGDWHEWLTRWGWQHVGGRYWKRPGKAGPGISATLGYCKGEGGHHLLYVFSANAAPFEAETSYSLFSAYAAAEHGGDYAAAARALAERGYNEKAEWYDFVYGPGRDGDGPAAGGPDEPGSPGGAVDATAADLIAHDATIRWVWDGWVPVGVLTILASEPGVGKTRLCADLARRVYHNLPWPDDQAPTCSPKSPVLWVAADNQHPELGTLPQQFGFPPEALYLNAPKANPFGGTMLDALEDLKDFEDRIKRVRPALVFIDTSLNATDRTAHKPEDAKAFFVPLQRIAQRTQSAIVCVTHTNASGKPLGRRITGQGRVVIQLERPDPDGQPDRRKLWVTKTNSITPPALGVTMGTTGNEYDGQPPVAPDGEQSFAQKSKVSECATWLREQFTAGVRAVRVAEIRDRAEQKGFSTRALYTAKEVVGLIEEVIRGKKWWNLPPDKDLG